MCHVFICVIENTFGYIIYIFTQYQLNINEWSNISTVSLWNCEDTF